MRQHEALEKAASIGERVREQYFTKTAKQKKRTKVLHRPSVQQAILLLGLGATPVLAMRSKLVQTLMAPARRALGIEASRLSKLIHR